MKLIFCSEPDPQNTAICFSYHLYDSERVKFEVFNIRGRCVASLDDGWQAPGEHSIYWSLDNLASGIYMIRFSAGNEKIMQKVTLLN